MATDGVKIIDGDHAHDIYSIFFEKYNQGATIEELRQLYETDKNGAGFDEEYYEICITAYALAFWEIGALTPDMLEEVKEVISQNATVIGWTEEVSVQAGKARQKELDKLLAKISKPRLRPKKREIEKKPTISPEEKLEIEKAQYEAKNKQYAKAQAIYKQLLERNPNLHGVRYQYIEMLYEIPKYNPDCPSFNFHRDGFGSEKHKQYCKYMIAHTNWKKIEDNCRYMLTHRDINRMEVSDRKKSKICDWYIYIGSSMFNALTAQQKYEEAILFIEEYIRFQLSRKGVGIGWIINDYGAIYRCLLMIGDQEKIESFKRKCISMDPDFIKSFTYYEEDLKKYGIETYLISAV